MTKPDNKLELGGVYKADWDDRPFRIIGLDDFEVFYDCLWPHDNSWTFSGNFKKKVFFYRISNSIFIKRSEKIDMLPLTDDEFNAFRPDLPMRIGRTKKIHWNEFPRIDHLTFESSLKITLDSEFLEQNLQTQKIVLAPYGRKRGMQKGSLIYSDSDFFTVAELIWKAKNIQESVNSERSNGIGIYRLGFEKQVPSYYIGENIDRAGIIKE